MASLYGCRSPPIQLELFRLYPKPFNHQTKEAIMSNPHNEQMPEIINTYDTLSDVSLGTQVQKALQLSDEELSKIDHFEWTLNFRVYLKQK